MYITGIPDVDMRIVYPARATVSGDPFPVQPFSATITANGVRKPGNICRLFIKQEKRSLLI